MLLVDRDHVGAVAFARMAREGAIHDVIGARALPADVAATAQLRAHLLAPLVPAHAWLTGLAALWMAGLAPAPLWIDLAGPRGAHRTLPPPGSPPLRFHGGPLAGLPPDAASPRAATVARASLDALAHCPAWLAIPATASGLTSGATSIAELRAVLDEFRPHSPSRARVAGLVDALAGL